eukprot:scaffold73772_cov51-Phaeocystis_antarctica.AAC.2
MARPRAAGKAIVSSAIVSIRYSRTTLTILTMARPRAAGNAIVSSAIVCTLLTTLTTARLTAAGRALRRRARLRATAPGVC